MSQVIEVPGFGPTEFPDEMSEQDIVAAIQKNMVPQDTPAEPSKTRSTVANVTNWMMQPYKDLGNLVTEVPTALATGMGSMIAGNIMGAGSDLYSSLTGQPKVGDQVREGVMKDYTYQPRSGVAQEFLAGAGKLLQESKLEGLPLAGQELPALAAAARKGVPAATELAGAKISSPSKKMLQFAKQNQTKIEAGEAARRLGLVYDVAETNPTAKNVIGANLARPEVIDIKASKLNMPKIQAILRQEAGVEGDVLTGKALEDARAKLSKPYDEVRQVGKLAPNADLAAKVRESVPAPIVGLEEQVKPAIKAASRVADKLEKGEITASEAVDAIRGYRNTANNWYKIAEKGDAKRNPEAMAKAYKAIADSLEDAIEANIPKDSPLLRKFRTARKDLAKNFTVEGIVNTESGIPDISRLNSARYAKAPLEGGLADLRFFQANFPEAAQVVNKYGAALPNTISRSTLGGSSGAAAAMAAGGSPGLGAIAGAASGLLGGRLIANRMLSPAYQAKNALPNVPRRIQPQAAVPPAPTSTLPVPYVAEGQFQPSGTPMPNRGPNWVPGRAGDAPDITPQQVPQLGYTPNAEMIRPRDWANRSRVMDAEAAAAEAAAPRAPTSGGTLFDLDQVTGKLRPVDQGIKGATPEAIYNTGNNLNSAVGKISKGQRFALSTEERIAWNKAQSDVVKAAPELKGLSDAAVAAKIADRQWVANRVQQLKTEYADWAKAAADKFNAERSAAINEQANSRQFLTAAERQAKKQAMSEAARRLSLTLNTRKARMQADIDALEAMSDNVGAASKIYTGQGPKTREFQRGMMTGEQ